MATRTGAHAAAVPPTKTRPGEHPYVSSCRVQTLARSKSLLTAAMCESISPRITVQPAKSMTWVLGPGWENQLSRAPDITHHRTSAAKCRPSLRFIQEGRGQDSRARRPPDTEAKVIAAGNRLAPVSVG